MKRVQQHIIEEESRKSFATLIPDGWVTNDFAKDYGKDIHIEIFKHYTSTGKSFIVQIKGTAQKITDNRISIRLQVETLKYFGTYTSPILLVFYSTEVKAFWGIWANNILRTATISAKKGQKSVLISLGSQNMLDRGFFQALERKFESSIPYKVSVCCSSDTPKCKVFTKRIVGWIEKYFPRCSEIDNPYLPAQIRLDVRETDCCLSPALKFCGRDFPLMEIDKQKDFNIISRPVLRESDISESEGELLFVLISFFIGLSVDGALKLLFFVIDKYNGKYKNTDSLLEIGRFAIAYNFIYELQKLIDKAKKHALFADFLLLNGAYLAFDNELRYLREYQENLKDGMTIFKGNEERSLIAYNLANNYRHLRWFHESSSKYQECRKLNNSYLNRYYWWHEYAGVLFCSGHYRFAEAFYQKSIEMDENKDHLPFTYGLRGDCCLRMGKVQDARDLYELYLSEVQKMERMPHYYFALASQVCDHLLFNGLAIQTYSRDEAIDLAKKGSSQKNLNLLKESLTKFPFDSFTWMEIGKLYGESGQLEDEYISNLVAAVLTDGMKALWMNVFISSQRLGTTPRSIMIYATMIQRFGNSVINDVSDLINEQPEMSDENKIIAIKYYKDVADSFKNKFSPMTYLPQRDSVRIVV